MSKIDFYSPIIETIVIFVLCGVILKQSSLTFFLQILLSILFIIFIDPLIKTKYNNLKKKDKEDYKVYDLKDSLLKFAVILPEILGFIILNICITNPVYNFLFFIIFSLAYWALSPVALWLLRKIIPR
jgi:hypothetical protein